MALVQGGLLDVLLYNILILRPFHSPLHDVVDLNLSLRVRVLHGRVDALFDFDELAHSLPVPLVSSVQLDSHLLDLGRDEDSSALRSRLGLANVQYDGIFIRLCRL